MSKWFMGFLIIVIAGLLIFTIMIALGGV